MTSVTLAMPEIVSQADWTATRQALLVEEKIATRMLDKIAAMRRQLPMYAVDPNHTFDGADGHCRLIDLFEQRRQLIVYHFMFGPDHPSPCPGCSRRMDDVGHLYHLYARDTAFVAVARASFASLAALRIRKGWFPPFFSSAGTTFNDDMGVQGDSDFGLSVFFRDDEGGPYRSYLTSGRGVEPAGFRALLDMTPFGRQEDWENSPPGWPQSPTYGWGSNRDISIG